MTDTITLTGLVATIPKHIVTNEGLTISSFRLASAQRRFDRSQERWIDGDTNWYTITAFRQLGVNCASSISKGDRIVVTGRLRIREWTSSERTGTTIDIEAEAIGHDLSWGTSAFSRTISSSHTRSPRESDPRRPHETNSITEAESWPRTEVGRLNDSAPAQNLLSEEADSVSLPY
ncbi:MAG: single-stranded DNA-binding protein [Rhodoglobus sp.]